ncbi:MAG: carboxylating nicotinate-nucleotide diphosphorylase [Gemmataceae bacterium]|nr:carboxylating nicotinate-nucleotide diphosphorylase [Gemmataceae bacterium]
MSTFTPAETAACQRLLALAFQEDLGERGDLTSQATIPADLQGQAVFVARSAGVIAGLPAVALVLEAVSKQVVFHPEVEDGAVVEAGRRLARVSGPMRALLSAERTALNFLQHLRGVATMTRRDVEAAGGLKARILDTRKTLPGWRMLEKYAVRCGGGHNHRSGLYDGILIKDNHLAALDGAPGAIARAVAAAQELRHHANLPNLPVEIEVDTLEQLDEALGAGPEIVLLDNMTDDQLHEAVRRRSAVAPQVQLEASGGVNLDTVRGIAATGVDRVSVGAITHSAPALDIGLDYLDG